MEVFTYIFYFVYILLIAILLRIITRSKELRDEDEIEEHIEHKFSHMLRDPHYHLRLQNAFSNVNKGPFHLVQVFTEMKNADGKENIV